MIQDVKISSTQLFLLMTGYIIGTSTLLPAAIIAYQDAWLAYLIGWLGGFLLVGMYTYISILNPSQTFIDILKITFGKALGTILGIIYLWYLFHEGSLIVRNAGNFISTTAYHKTPTLFIMAILMIVTTYLVKEGIEVIARSSELFVPLLCFLVIITFFLLIGLFNFDYLFPFFERGVMPVLKASFYQAVFPFGQMVSFLMIFPYLNRTKKAIKVSFMATTWAGGLICFSVLSSLLVLGPDLMLRNAYPAHAMARLIPNIDIDPFIFVNLLIGALVKTSINLYAFVIGLTQVVGLDDYKTFVLPTSILFVVFSLWDFESVISYNQWSAEIWLFYVIPFQIILPLIVLIISLVRRKIALT